MKGLILLDGPDCSGKTTLCTTIIQQANVRGYSAMRHHLGRITKGKTWEIHAEAAISYIKKMNSEDIIVIADRHFLSEGVYGRVYRDGGEYPYAMRYMDMLFNRACALKVICCPSTETVVRVHKKMKEERHEEYSDGMDKVANIYQAIWHSSVSPTSLPGGDYTSQLAALGGVQDKALWYRYNYEIDDVRLYANYLLDELYEESSSRNLFESLSFNGTPGKRSTLIVGDHMDNGNRFSIPFFENSGPSLFFAKTLHKLAIHAEELCLVNIKEPEGLSTVIKLAPICKRVVVIGREAERDMRLHGINFDAFCRHPRHAEKFNQNDDTYAQELRIALGGK